MMEIMSFAVARSSFIIVRVDRATTTKQDPDPFQLSTQDYQVLHSTDHKEGRKEGSSKQWQHLNKHRQQPKRLPWRKPLHKIDQPWRQL
jgi:hypothetical protein